MASSANFAMTVLGSSLPLSNDQATPKSCLRAYVVAGLYRLASVRFPLECALFSLHFDLVGLHQVRQILV